MAEPFSQILKRYKKENALTSREMAEIIGLSERMYAYYEKGEYDGQPSRIGKYLHKLAKKSDVPPPPPGGNVALHSNGLDAGNHITMNDNPDFIEGYFTIKGLPANDGAWLVNGHSMYPTISKGSRVILKKLENIDLIVFGEIYAVDLREHGGKIKRIKKGRNAEHWLLASAGPAGSARTAGGVLPVRSWSGNGAGATALCDAGFGLASGGVRGGRGAAGVYALFVEAHGGG